MQECISNPTPADEVELLHKTYKTGPYSEAYKPEILKWALQTCTDIHSHIGQKKNKKPFGSGTGTGKLQLEAERQKLISELENG